MSANACGLMQHDLFGAEPEPFRPPREKSFEPVPDSKEMVRVAPNVWAWRPSNPDRVPRYGRHMWVKNPDGTYRPAPQESRFVIVSREVLDEIGFKGMSRSVSDTTLRRLAEANPLPEYWLTIYSDVSGDECLHAVRRSKLELGHPGHEIPLRQGRLDPPL